jgi:hypothetical protein
MAEVIPKMELREIHGTTPQKADYSIFREKVSSLNELYELVEETYSHNLAKHALTVGISTCPTDIQNENLLKTLLFRKVTFDIKQITKMLYHVKLGKDLILNYYLIKDGKTHDESRTFYLFLSDDNRARTVLHTFFRNAKPYFENSLIPQHDMFDVIDEFAESTQTKLLFVDGTLKMPGETRRIWKKRPIPYDRELLKKRAFENNGRWSSIVVQTGDNSMKFRIYEEGFVTLYHGSYKLLYMYVIRSLLRKIDENSKMFREVEQNAPSDSKLKIVQLTYPTEIDRGTLFQIRDTLSTRYVTSVLHAGNPYLHMELIDRKDFSNLALFASGNKIELIPGRKITLSTLVEIVALLLDILPTLQISIKPAGVE